MSTVSGKVIEVFRDGVTKTGRNIGSRFGSVTLEGNHKLTCFDLNFIADVLVGGEYTFTVEQSGQYVNIVGETIPVIQTLGTGSLPERAITPGHPTVKEEKPFIFPKPLVDKDLAIRKAVALKAAVEYVIATMGGTSKESDVIECAEIFEEYLA